MASILLSENPEHPAFAELGKHRIGDRVRIVRINMTDKYADETRRVLQASLGRILTIKEIVLWETGQPARPFHITYEFYVGHLVGAPNNRSWLETIFMDDDEIEPLRKRRAAP
jgi:hypothetical protein